MAADTYGAHDDLLEGAAPAQRAENTRLIVQISCVATLGGFLFGFDSGVINGTIDGLKAACQSGATEPSHVLTAMGLSPARARASLRFSLSKLNTEEEIDEALKLIPPAVARLRDLSPTYKTREVALAG